jgi:peptide/nickel transport system substrate-binding protein
VKASGVSDPKLTFATSPSYDPELIQTIQSDLQAVGITVNISNTDQATYLSKVQDKSHDWGSLRVGLWSCSCLDADGVLLPLFHTGSIWSSYSSPTFDALVDDARTTLSAAKRKSDYAKAVAIINKDLPGIGLYQVDSIYGAASSLTWKPDAVQSMYVDQMTITGK